MIRRGGASGSDALRVRYLAWCRGGTPPAEPIRGLVLSGMREHRTRAMARPRGLADEQLRAVSVPALVLLGGRSPIHDPQRAARRARALLPDARVEVVPGATHGLPADRPEQVRARLLEFLDDRA